MVVIVDYGMGNIFSIQSALRFLGVESRLTRVAEDILRAKRIILPGVGSFRRAMESLKATELDVVLREVALENKTPLLGICLGMQLLGCSSIEDGFTEGLSLIDVPIERFVSEDPDIKIPHVGFDTVVVKDGSTLFRGFSREVDFYFTHSFYMRYDNNPYVSGACYHGINFAAGVEKNNIFGTQFHPEKSQSNGLIVLKNFMEWEKV